MQTTEELTIGPPRMVGGNPYEPAIACIAKANQLGLEGKRLVELSMKPKSFVDGGNDVVIFTIDDGKPEVTSGSGEQAVGTPEQGDGEGMGRVPS